VADFVIVGPALAVMEDRAAKGEGRSVAEAAASNCADGAWLAWSVERARASAFRSAPARGAPAEQRFAYGCCPIKKVSERLSDKIIVIDNRDHESRQFYDLNPLIAETARRYHCTNVTL